jgi:hypothetical protein
MHSDPRPADRAEESSPAIPSISPQKLTVEEVAANGSASQKPRDKNRNDREGIPQKWEIGIAAFLAVVNALALIIYAFQLVEMRKSTDAATRAAQSAEEATKAAKASTRLDQRAWVSAMEVVGTPTIGSPLEIQVNIQNFGKTFAYELKTVGAVYEQKRGILSSFGSLGSDQPPYDAEIEKVGGTGDGSRSLLPPTGSSSISLRVPLRKEPVDEEYLSRIKAGTIKIYVFGKLTYRDVFGEPHWLTYCYWLDTDLVYKSNTSYNDTDHPEY